MRIVVAIGVVVLLAMQARLWFSEVGILARRDLDAHLAEQQRRTQELSERNRALAIEVAALKAGLAGVESRARSELGMIKNGETFYLVVDH